MAAAALCGDPTAIASLRVRSFRDLYGCGFASLEQKTHLLELAVEYVTCQCVCVCAPTVSSHPTHIPVPPPQKRL